VNLFFRLLLDGERVYADLAVVGGIETLDVADDLLAFFRRELLKGRVVGEGEVGAFPLFELVQKFEYVALFVAFAKFSVFVAAVIAIQRVGFEAGFPDKVPEFGRAAVDEFSAEFEDLALFTKGADAATDTISSFKDEHTSACLSEKPGGGESGHAGANDQYALTCRVHQSIGCFGSLEVIWNRDHLLA
jgi:hypothetical protein